MVSRGFSGYNSLFCRVMLPRIITGKDASSIASIFIFLGANDSNRADLSPQCVPLEDYHANLVAMVEYLVVSSVSTNTNVVVIMYAFCLMDVFCFTVSIDCSVLLKRCCGQA